MNSSITPENSLPISEVVQRIVTLNEGLQDFWSSSHGWAPPEAADLLQRSRLDWQVSLSRSLNRWLESPTEDERAAVQILGYGNLGALVEGTLKLFLAVYFEDYKRSSGAIKRRDKVQVPDGMTFHPLRNFFKNHILFSRPSDNWDPWIHRIQSRRNAIHAFKDRDIGVHTDLIGDIRLYLRFLRRINNQLPYPDDVAEPMESYDLLEDYDLVTDAPIL